MNMAYKYDPNKYNLNKYRNLDIKTQEPEEVNRQKITIQSKNADKNSSLKIVVGAVIVMVMLFCVIYGKVQVSDMYNQINEQKAVLENLENENARLKVSIESYASLENIESHAERIGLKKIDKAQIWYIDLSDGDDIRISQTDDNIFVRIRKVFSSLSE
ncbi:MAG: hypothetical protein E7510_06590 [Ruminococcus sp.]|nr:hypothetical protein [Ruminococcus sp.]MBR6599158.1 hypothetical protein [Oscillospiraceae bacterium]